MKAKRNAASVHPLNFTLYPFSASLCLCGEKQFPPSPLGGIIPD